MQKKTVSITRFGNDRENIAKAIDMCEGFRQLKPNDRILLKPNLVMWDNVYPFPKFGVLTTSVVVEEIVRLLQEYGCTQISIGEGTIVDRELGSDTRAAFRGLGYEVLQKRYGVRLIDFNDGPFAKVDCGSYSLDVAGDALDTDFLINIPVLKTHNSTRVSLGFKNLKGCLNSRSKMFCHHRELPLDGFISRLGEILKPGLTVIDGIYALEKGPVVNGRAWRADLIVASRDMFAADAVGARLLGFKPAEISHLREYATRHGLTGTFPYTVGEKLEEVALPLAWDWEWLEDNSGPAAFARLGIKGVNFPKYDNTICSGCSYLNNFLLVTLMGSYQKQPFFGLEFLGGKKQLSRGGFDKTFLFGSCAVAANKDNPAIKEAVPIKGCPPHMEKILKILNEHGIMADSQAYRHYRENLYKRYLKEEGFDELHFAIS